MGTWHDVDIGCPFYLRDDGKTTIFCEGICYGCTTKLSFRKKDDYLIHLRTFCMMHYERCEVFRVAMEKYKD